MDKNIRGFFEKFRSNYEEWQNIEQEIMKPNSQGEWFADYCKSMVRLQALFDENKENILHIRSALDCLDDDTASQIYEELLTSYFGDYNDAELLILISRKLLDYYLKTDDYSKQTNLYAIIQNYYFEIDNPEGKGRNMDISYLKEGMKYIDRYEELDDSARYRIWIMYYNYIVRLTDYKVVPLKDAIDCYEKIMAFSERPEIKKLDEGFDKLHNLKKYITETFFIGIGELDEADDETKRRFYDHARKYFDVNEESLKSLYELSSEIYISYLYVKFFEKEITVDEIFEKYLEYFIYKFRFIKEQSEFDSDELIQCINAINYLAKLGKYVSNSEMVEKALDIFVDFAQGKWIKSSYSDMDRVNEMFGKVCVSLLAYDTVGIDKEKIITQLIVQRDVHVYIHARITAEIAIAIYREIGLKNISFFDGVTEIPRSKWKDYLYYSSMFHDIGEEKMLGCVKFRSRPLFADEIKRNAGHVESGTRIFENIPSISMYVDAIKGHHTYYNCKPDICGYDRNKSLVAPFVDILSLAVFIEEATNPYWDFEQKSRPFHALLTELENEKNKRFNGELIELILNNKLLQKQLEKIVTSVRDEIIYDVCHNWEKIQLSQDEESVLDDINEHLEEYKRTHDEDAFRPYLVKLEHLSKNSARDDIKGKALYYLMLYYFVGGKYYEGLALESECNRLLRITNNYELLAQNMINLGRVELFRDNQERALDYFLNGISIAKRTPGCEKEENITYLYIAGIYVVNHHYVKAEEYYKLCKPTMFEPIDRLNFLCMHGYCNVKLNNCAPIGKIKEELEKLIEECEYLAIFPQYIYLAIFSQQLGLNEDMEKYLKMASETDVSSEDVLYYIDEMLMYLEFLGSLKRFSLMLEKIDTYIALVRNVPAYSSYYVKLANAKIKCMAYINNHFEYRECEDMIAEAATVSIFEKAKHLEEIENTILENIRIREEHDEFLSHKEFLEESVKKAQSESEQKSRFLSSMSHEIRTPINAILGLNEMILRESSEEDVLKYAADIHSAGKQLLGIINDVLDYSKIEAGKMELVPQRYELGALLNDIKNMIEPKLHEKNLKFIISCNDAIPNVLFGDDLRIKQVLINLLSNAYKYTKQGTVKFGIDYEKKDEKSIIIKFSVKDTGIGLKPEQIEKLAIPFERFDLVKNRGVEGTGLGMSIVMKLLEQMNSHLVIESEYGQGSEFSFEIEQGVIEWRKLGKLDDIRKQITRNTADRHKASSNGLYAPQAKILIVDDNAVNLKVAGALLKRTGIQVTSAMSGQECLELCKANVYHMILLDHMMPEMDGIETLKHLKEQGGPNASIPVIALTANVVESIDDFYIKQGFDALLAKPISADKMEETISYYLPDYLLETKE